MKLLIVGPQGSGKGTQAKIIAEKLNVPDISMGGLLRNTEGDLKKEVDSYINKGLLAPPEVVVKALKQRIEKQDCENGFVLDGFPRSMEQVRLSEGILDFDKVVLIDISDEMAVKRLGGRLTCKKCGAVFNINTKLPKQEGICDYCNSGLYIRDDDKEEAIKQRLGIYHKETKPILEKYEDKLIRVDGEQDIDKVTEDILKELNE